MALSRRFAIPILIRTLPFFLSPSFHFLCFPSSLSPFFLPPLSLSFPSSFCPSFPSLSLPTFLLSPSFHSLSLLPLSLPPSFHSLSLSLWFPSSLSPFSPFLSLSFPSSFCLSFPSLSLSLSPYLPPSPSLLPSSFISPSLSLFLWLLSMWLTEPGKAEEVVEAALRAGYRRFDCSPRYNNDKEVGGGAAEVVQGWTTQERGSLYHFQATVRD